MKETQNESFAKFLQELKTFHTGLHKVLDGKFNSFCSEYQVVWQHNNTRLLKFPSKNESNCCKTYPVLFIPSLINRGYILDIAPKYSFVEFLSEKFTCYLIDWGEPSLEEANYKFEDYYTNKVIKILNFIYEQHDKKINLIGYCLGGIISILSAVLNEKLVNRLILLACPWDFSCYKEKILIMKPFIDRLLEKQKLISSHFIRNFFLSFMPMEKIYGKFIAFTSLASDDSKRDLFFRVEKWAMHNLYISNAVMKEIIYDFALHDILINNNWTIHKKRVDLKSIKKKTFIVSGESDAVVPYISSKPLIKQLSNHHTVLSSSGHIGIIIGKKAREWQYELVNWLSC